MPNTFNVGTLVKGSEVTPQQKAQYRMMFQARLSKVAGMAFQNLFSDIMKYANPHFVPVKPQGNQGDWKNDGHDPKTGRYYQVYSPEQMSDESAAVKKLEEDFAGLLAKWGDKTVYPNGVKEFWFVLNDHYRVTPGGYGRATMHDKDLLIYIESHLVAAFNRGETPSRTVSFSGYHYLKVTGKNTWSDDYRRLKLTLDRLRGTTIKTNIKTGGREITTSFGLIDAWTVIEAGKEDERKVAICVTISEWLYNAIKASEILTLNPAYFGLRKPLERRMYEIARKHAGRQGLWEIGFETLRTKCGSTVERARQFRSEVKKIAAADNLPDYRVTVTAAGKVRFISRDPAQVAKRLAKPK